MRIKIGTVIVGDSRNGIVVTSLDIDGRRVVDVQEFPEGLETKVFDRGNRSKAISFSATRQHKDTDAAFKFAWLHDELVPIKADVEIGGPYGGWRLFLVGAGVPVCQSKAEGCRTYHNYQIVGGLLATKK